MLSNEEQHIILETLKPFKPSCVGVFGSYARNEETEHSDIDIAYDFEAEYSFFDLIEIKETLFKKLNKQVDLISLKYMKPYFKKYIDDDLIFLLNEKNKQIIS